MITLLVAVLLAGQSYNDPPPDCANPMNGLEIRDCLDWLDAAETKRMDRYLSAAKASLMDRKSASGEDLSSALTSSQIKWQVYADATCSVYQDAGENRSADCLNQLTQQRTHALWEFFLTGPGGPVGLEEPEPLMLETDGQ